MWTLMIKFFLDIIIFCLNMSSYLNFYLCCKWTLSSLILKPPHHLPLPTNPSIYKCCFDMPNELIDTDISVEIWLNIYVHIIRQINLNNFRFWYYWQCYQGFVLWKFFCRKFLFCYLHIVINLLHGSQYYIEFNL